MAPIYDPNGENKIKVTVIAVDSANQRSEESAELQIDVKTDTTIKPTRPSLSADLNGQSDVVENKNYKVTASTTANGNRKIVKYEWNVNGTKVETESNVLERTAPAFNAIAGNKIKVKVVAIDNAGVRSEESQELQIGVKANKLPFKPGVNIKSGDIVQDKLIYPNKTLTLEATVPANESANVKEYRWYLNDQLLQNENGKQLTYTTPTYDKNNRGLIFKVKAIGKRDQESDASDEIKLIALNEKWKNGRTMYLDKGWEVRTREEVVKTLNSHKGQSHATVKWEGDIMLLSCAPGYFYIEGTPTWYGGAGAEADFPRGPVLDLGVKRRTYNAPGNLVDGPHGRKFSRWTVACEQDPDPRPW
ncbi:hypothetical protein KX00_1450 [Francisella sp. TX07-6608]|nr:hypothetical protein KX00_1450 [Francisella sp. TX07-6608]